MHAAGVQDRTRTDPSQTLPRTVTEAPESSPIVLVSAWLFYGLASLGAVFGLIRIGFWVLSKFKREFSSETREGRLAQPFSNYESPPPEGATMLENLMEQRADSELQTRIRMRAYELYEARGRVDGLDQEDWFHAEREIFGDLNHPAEVVPLPNETKLSSSLGSGSTLAITRGPDRVSVPRLK